MKRVALVFSLMVLGPLGTLGGCISEDADSPAVPTAAPDPERLDDRVLEQFLASQSQEYREKTLQEGTVVAIATGYQVLGSDGKPTGEMRAVQCTSRGCRNFDYTNDMTREEYEQLAVPYVAATELVSNPDEMAHLINYAKYGDVVAPTGTSEASTQYHGLSLTLSVVKYAMDGSKHKYRLNTYWSWSSCETCCRYYWAPGNALGNYVCSGSEAGGDAAGSSGEDSDMQDWTDLEWSNSWSPYTSGGQSGNGDWLNNRRVDGANYDNNIWQEDETTSAVTYKFYDCYNWINTFLLGNNCSSVTMASPYGYNVQGVSWNGHGWSDKYIYRYNLPTEDTTVIYRYWHTYGNTQYSLSIGAGPSVSISNTNAQWMVHLPVTWSRSTY